MNHGELLQKYNALLRENQQLHDEIRTFKEQFGIIQPPVEFSSPAEQSVVGQLSFLEKAEVTNNPSPGAFNKYADPAEKIGLFRSLFRGRDDVFAKRWQNQKGTSGYSPVCSNEWQAGLCLKPQGRCFDCTHKSYVPLSDRIIDEHLRGKLIAGVYPLLPDEYCWFLAIDFDDEEWQRDVSAIREVCVEFGIPIAVERSRSGQGAHVWVFFEHTISASLARKLGSAILTFAMSRRHELNFKSYDRLFPNQDTLPKGGLGNLIALPLQKAARDKNNSIFIDKHFQPYEDQWGFLGSLRRLSETEVEDLIAKLCHGNVLGVLKKDEEETNKPWETVKSPLKGTDFPQSLEVVKGKMLYIPKLGITERALNQIKRLAAFKNPEFFKAQAMRMPTFNKPRVISCSEEAAEYICLPRGCDVALEKMLTDVGVSINWADKTNGGKHIDVEFKGRLREEQPIAANEMLKHSNGILSGTTAFGKTVVAIKLIAERKTNTLILVDKVSLVSQWKEQITNFLTINEVRPEIQTEKKRGRKKPQSIIGQIGAGKENPSGIIDIAVMQSLNRKGEVKECIKNYGMIIVDECHHISAFSFEQIMKETNARYVYGLTATPTRKDGHHPIIFMQCGPIRYRDNAIKQAEKRPFDHYIIPRFTSFKIPLDKTEKEPTIQKLYSEIVVNEERNRQITEDVIRSHAKGRNCIVLTQRTAHVEWISKELSKVIPDVIPLTGGMGAKDTQETMKRIADTPFERPLTLVATGKYIGEGFDEPRLDTLFLAMPISWKGTLHQYAGRLHRLFEGKSEVQIYDYVDIHVKMLERMYSKRLSGYASIGYKAKGESIESKAMDIIFDKQNFLPVYSNDLINSEKEIIIVSPFITKKRIMHMLRYLRVAVEKKVKVVVVTRPGEDFQEKDQTRLSEALALLREEKIRLVFRSQLHQKFAVLDQKLVWYGSINLLSYGSAEESIMRLESYNIAHELIKSIG